VPKSRVRKKAVYTPPPPKTGRRKVSPPWVGPTIVASLIIGLAWIVVFYTTQNGIPGLSALGSWNLVVGFAFIIGGVTLSTRWRLPSQYYGASCPFLTTIATTIRASMPTVASTWTAVRFLRGAYA
jgi:hypothetical protein